MKIRTAEIKDSPTIITLWEQANLTRPWNNPEDDIKRSLSNPTSTLLVGEIVDKIIGTVMTGYDGHRGWLYYLAVENEFQKNGYGKQLVMAAEGWLKSINAPKVLLMVRESNTAVLKFYNDIGYEDNDVIVVGKWLEENK
jgi:ribosomal protein S18 acetylase RimI-like enzyme